MKQFLYLFCGMIVLPLILAGQEESWSERVKKYIDRYDEVAVEEMNLFGIPASVTLAQGIIESSAGGSKLAREANNHFGIKCHKEWNGLRYHLDDDAPDECFRKYDDPVESYRDHSLFLSQRERYRSLFALDVTNYAGWCTGLKAAGYATNPKYAEMLIKTIETYQLYLYDRRSLQALNDPDSVHSVSPDWQLRYPGLEKTGHVKAGRDIYRNYGLKVIIAGSADNIYQVSTDLGLDAGKLLRYNELNYATALKPGQLVYLQAKRKRAYSDSHVVKKGESLYDISQQYGIRIARLYKVNPLEPGLEPREGVVLLLR